MAKNYRVKPADPMNNFRVKAGVPDPEGPKYKPSRPQIKGGQWYRALKGFKRMDDEYHWRQGGIIVCKADHKAGGFYCWLIRYEVSDDCWIALPKEVDGVATNQPRLFPTPMAAQDHVIKVVLGIGTREQMENKKRGRREYRQKQKAKPKKKVVSWDDIIFGK